MAAQTVSLSFCLSGAAVLPAGLSRHATPSVPSCKKIAAAPRSLKVVRAEASQNREQSQTFIVNIPTQGATFAAIAAIGLSFGTVDSALAELSARQEGRNTVLENLNSVKDAAAGKLGESTEALKEFVPEAPGVARSSSGAASGKVDDFVGQVSRAGKQIGEQAGGAVRSGQKATGDLAVKADAIVPQEGTVVGGAPTPDTVTQAGRKLQEEYGSRIETGGPNQNEQKVNELFGNVLGGGPVKEAKEQIGEALQGGVESIKDQLPGQ